MPKRHNLYHNSTLVIAVIWQHLFYDMHMITEVIPEIAVVKAAE